MIKVVDTLFSKLPFGRALAVDSTLFTKGNLIYRDTSAGTVKEATSSAGKVLDLLGIVKKTQTTGTGSYIDYEPVLTGSIFVVADCTNNTAADQLNKVHAMTDAGHVANTSTSITTTLGVFVALGLVGAAADKKLYGYFIRIEQVVS